MSNLVLTIRESIRYRGRGWSLELGGPPGLRA